jgi:hypothetical protein
MDLSYQNFTTSQASHVHTLNDSGSSETNPIRHQVAIIQNIQVTFFVIELLTNACLNSAGSQH